MIKYFFVFLFSFSIIRLYISLARKKKIFDIPNTRSSHKKVTVRGAGLIIPLVLFFLKPEFFTQNLFFLIGIVLLAVVSFLDDLKGLSNRFRFLAHILAVLLLFANFQIFNLTLIYQVGLFFLYLGIINAVNFMDGINGITGIYSLVFLTSFLFVISKENYFTYEYDLVLFLILAMIAFLFFNFRKTAVCFLGDVGSVSLAYIYLFLISKYIINYNDYRILFFLFVYGLDTGYTIIFRLQKNENVFTAHRSHLFQLLVNNKGYSPIIVSLIFGTLQIFLNLLLFYYYSFSVYFIILLIITLLYHFYRKSLGFNIIFFNDKMN